MVRHKPSHHSNVSLLCLTLLNRLGGRFIFGPMDMEQLNTKRHEIVERDLLKLKLVV